MLVSHMPNMLSIKKVNMLADKLTRQVLRTLDWIFFSGSDSLMTHQEKKTRQFFLVHQFLLKIWQPQTSKNSNFVFCASIGMDLM